MPRLLVLAALGLVLTGCPRPLSAERDALLGAWEGTVTEGDVQYQLRFAVDQLEVGEKAGAAVYSGEVSCTGALTLVGSQGSHWRFQEAVDDLDACVDGGTIAAHPEGDTLRWEWYAGPVDGTPDAVADLTRKAER